MNKINKIKKEFIEWLYKLRENSNLAFSPLSQDMIDNKIKELSADLKEGANNG